MSSPKSKQEPLPVSISKQLVDRSYEKRRLAAVNLEQYIREITDHSLEERIIQSLCTDYIGSKLSNTRRGGVLGLAAVAIALQDGVCTYLDTMVPPILQLFDDPDPKVRYYSCESLYNIIKVTRAAILPYFSTLFRALCRLQADSDREIRNGAELLDRLVKDVVTESIAFDLEAFVPLLQEEMTQSNPHIRQLVLGWVSVLHAVPDFDMLQFLPSLLPGMIDMLSDLHKDIRQQADALLDGFNYELHVSHDPTLLSAMVGTLVTNSRSSSKPAVCRITALLWLNAFIQMDGQALKDDYDAIVDTLMTCLSDEDPHICAKAEQVNTTLMALVETIASQEHIPTIIRNIITSLVSFLPGIHDDVRRGSRNRIAVLQWISMLFIDKNMHDLQDVIKQLYDSLINTLASGEDTVVLLDLQILAKIAMVDESHFNQVTRRIIFKFASNPGLLRDKGSMIVRQLCTFIDAERVYLSFAALLLEKQDAVLTAAVVRRLNTILMTSTELQGLRDTIRQPKTDSSIFTSLYTTWCYAPVAAVCLCCLAQYYSLASRIVDTFGDIAVSVSFLTDVDQLVQLIESPMFIHLRLQLLEPRRNTSLLKVLCGLLMLLPQSKAFDSLRRRLQSVSFLSTLPESDVTPDRPKLDLSADELQRLMDVYNQAQKGGATR